MPKTIYMMKGLQASGKSTRAKEMLAEFGAGNAKRISKDDLRAMLDNSKWTPANEKFIIQVRDSLIVSALQQGLHVIVDDTNLAPKHSERLRQLARENGAAFEVVDFTHVSLEECIERDRKRQNYVGEKVIRDTWKQFLAPPVQPIPHDQALPSAVIFDIDGTLALMNGRGPFEWDKVDSDHCNEPVALIARLVHEGGLRLVLVSGRDESCREKTVEWIAKRVGIQSYELYMRPAGDNRDDRIIKRELYERHIQGKYNVHCIFDDRNKVVTQWREMGLPCFQVAEGDF